MLKGPSPLINTYNPSAAQSETFFQGQFNSTQITRDPLITGYAFIKWMGLPSWVEEVYPHFRQFTEKNLRGFQGLQDIEMSNVEIQEGFSQSPAAFAGSAQKAQGFTLTHREYSGSPVRNAYTHWVTGIRDPSTNIARYPRDYGLPYSAANHTAELMYIMTRPDADSHTAGQTNIEFACLWTMVMPTRIHLSHLNFQAGSNDAVSELEQQFSGIPHISPVVDEMAVALLADTYQFQTMGDFQK